MAADFVDAETGGPGERARPVSKITASTSSRPRTVVATRRFPLKVSDVERRLLNSWVAAGTTPQRVVRRARIVLLAAEGLSIRQTAERLLVALRTAMLWRRRFEEEGAETLWRDAPGRGRRPTALADGASRVQALLATPPVGGGRWTIRALSAATGLSRASVHRIVRAMQTIPRRRR